MIGRALLRFSSRAHVVQLNGSTNLPRVSFAIRSYATPGRPKSVVGEPSRPVKRAVKKAATKPNTGDSAAEVKVQEKKRAASKRKTAKKTLTAEQLEAQNEKKEKKVARQRQRAKASRDKKKKEDLLEAALEPPPSQGPNSFIGFFAEHMKGRTLGRGGVGSNAREITEKWKSLSPAEIEHYNHIANERRRERQAEYKRWLESYTPEQIHQANLARAALRRQAGGSPQAKAKWRPIRDERIVKRPLSSYSQFSVNRYASGDFKNIKLSESSKLISAEWKALSEDERKKYQSIYRQDMDRYVAEHASTYGSPPPYVQTNTQAEAVAAAA